MKSFFRKADAERLLAENAERVAEIERGLIERILERTRGGEDPQTAAAAEVHRALAQLDAASAAFTKALDALPSYPEARDDDA